MIKCHDHHQQQRQEQERKSVACSYSEQLHTTRDWFLDKDILPQTAENVKMKGLWKMKDDIFNPNSYTEKAMPLTSAFCNMLVNYGNLGMNSDEMQTFISKRVEACKKLENTLNKEQQEMLFDMEYDSIDQHATENTEYFCRGMKFGIMLMKELLG